MQIQLPDCVNDALQKLNNAGYEAFIVGGCMRDILIGSTPKDYDITTSALPDETKKVFAANKVIETGIAHGTVTVLYGKTPLEITTYRIDGSYSDNRHPDNVRFTPSLFEDAARRDFTMNAISYNPNAGIRDFFSGNEDIKNKLIRCVGDPKIRFHEDALRILRALRFSSVLGFSIEENTKNAIFNCRELLLNVSAERTASELIKLLCGKYAREVIIEYADVLGVFIPEILPMKGFLQHNKHHIYDVLTHTAYTVDNIESTPVLRLAALFHDIGKPNTFSISEDGTGHFYGHAKKSAEIAKDVFLRLKLDNATRNTVCCLVERHDVQIEETEKAVKRWMAKLSPDIFSMLMKLKRADNLSQAPEYLCRQQYYDRMEALAERIKTENQCFSLKDLALDGNDIISLGIPKGKMIGDILSDVLYKVINEELINDKEEITRYIGSHYLK